MANEQALQGVNVLDLSLDIGGAYCTKLLADLGADVLMVEPLGGTPLRRMGPFPDERNDAERGGLFRYLCSNKQGATLDLDDPAGQRRVLDLAAQADLLVETFPPGRMDQAGLGYDALRKTNPALVFTSVTHFGQTGPYKDWQGEEIVDYALGGYLYFGGHPDREPLMVPNNQPQLHAGAQAAIGSLAALWYAHKTGQGQQVDVSAVEAMLSAHCWTSAAWTHEGKVMRRTLPDAIKCKDGWVVFMFAVHDPTIFLVIDRPELMKDSRFTDRQSWHDHRTTIVDILTQGCASHTTDEVFRKAQGLRIPVTPVYDAKQLLEAREMIERGWALSIDDGGGGLLTIPGAPYKFSETPPEIRAAAPRLGAQVGSWPQSKRTSNSVSHHTDHPSLKPDLAPVKPLPLAGVRLLEVTGHWAGPLAGRYLADLGADVMKIEPTDRLVTRGGHFAGNQPWVRHYNRAAYFNKMNRNKFGATLNLRSEAGRDLFLRLVRETDVFLDNLSPRVLPNLNLEYETLQAVNPGLVHASISAFGQTGPARDYIAYGANIEGSSGLMAVTGYRNDDQPYRTSLFYADPIIACHAAFAILAALFHRRRTGRGQHIDLSLQESGASFFAESILEHTVTGKLAPHRGNRHRSSAPQGCYPSYGDDMWVVLSVRGDDDWRALCPVLNDDRLTDARFATVEGRRLHHDEIDQIIGEWTSHIDHHEAAARLQNAGVPAAPVLANWELVSNRHLHQRGFYVPVDHPEMGVFPYPGMPWKLSVSPGAIRCAAPQLAADNKLIFQQVLGLDDAALEDLLQRRIVADGPPPDDPGPYILP